MDLPAMSQSGISTFFPFEVHPCLALIRPVAVHVFTLWERSILADVHDRPNIYRRKRQMLGKIGLLTIYPLRNGGQSSRGVVMEISGDKSFESIDGQWYVETNFYWRKGMRRTLAENQIICMYSLSMIYPLHVESSREHIYKIFGTVA